MKSEYQLITHRDERDAHLAYCAQAAAKLAALKSNRSIMARVRRFLGR